MSLNTFQFTVEAQFSNLSINDARALFEEKWRDVIEKQDLIMADALLKIKTRKNYEKIEYAPLILEAAEKQKGPILGFFSERRLSDYVFVMSKLHRKREIELLEFLLKNVSCAKQFSLLKTVVATKQFPLFVQLLADPVFSDRLVEQNNQLFLIAMQENAKSIINYIGRDKAVVNEFPQMLRRYSNFVTLINSLHCEISSIQSRTSQKISYYQDLCQDLSNLLLKYDHSFECAKKVIIDYIVYYQGASAVQEELNNLLSYCEVKITALEMPVDTPAGQFSAFVARLEQSKERAINTSLDKLIAKKDLNNIFEYILKEKQTALSSMNPGEAYRIAKSETSLARTVVVLRAMDGEYKLMVETKSKLANNQKAKLDPKVGVQKAGKPAWRIDGCEEEYFNLVTEIPHHNLQPLCQLIREYNISNSFNSEYINKYDLGAFFLDKFEKLKLSFYSPKTTCDLSDIIFEPKEFEALTEDQKNNIILQMLCAIRDFHQIGINQDLKPDNILINRTNSGLKLKLTDFGQSVFNNCLGIAAGSPIFNSPEITCYFKNKSLPFYDFAYELSLKNRGDDMPHPANDIWSAGMVVFLLHFGRFPELVTSEADMKRIQQVPLLKCMLAAKREERGTIEKAIEIHQAEMLLKSQKTYLLQYEFSQLTVDECTKKITQRRNSDKY